MTRTIAQIAQEIEQNWNATSKNGVNYAAKPYLSAMTTIHSADPNAPYIFEDARTQIIYFLANANSYRGEVAKAHKAELKKIAGIK